MRTDMYIKYYIFVTSSKVSKAASILNHLLYANTAFTVCYCWLGSRKGIPPVKKSIECLYVGYCNVLTLGTNNLHMFRIPAVTTATFYIACCSKTQNSLIFWYQLTEIVLENECRFIYTSLLNKN